MKQVQKYFDIFFVNDEVRKVIGKKQKNVKKIFSKDFIVTLAGRERPGSIK